MKIYLGYETVDISWDERDEIMASEQYSNMPVYPATGCVQKINGIWVVKLCD
jgi:hypothetical protein